MNLTDAKLAQGGCEKLDLAMLSFFEQFTKIYLGNQVQKSSKVMCYLKMMSLFSDFDYSDIL